MSLMFLKQGSLPGMRANESNSICRDEILVLLQSCTSQDARPN